jgi:RNA polymerase sigma-70 factor (ECF subfamily)
VDVPESHIAQPVVIPDEAPVARVRGSGPAVSRDILAGVQARAPEALAAFFEAYFDRVFGLVYRLLGNRAGAEDVTQEVFYKVQRAAHRLDPDRDPMPWLAAIAHNTCRDYWRSGAYRLGRRSASIEQEPAVQGSLAAATDPERDALAAEREALVQAAISELPEMLRVPVVLHDYQGLSHEEVAEILGIRHDAARKRYSRALKALGQRLRETMG